MIERFDRKNNKDSFFLLVIEDETGNTYNEIEFEEGVHLCQYVKNTLITQMISSVIYIQDKLVSENKNVFTVVLYDGDQIKTKSILPEFLYSGTINNNKAFSWMLNNGLKIHTQRQSLLKEYLILCEDKAQIKTATEFNGWQEINGKWEYIANGFSTCEISYVGDSRVSEFQTKGDKNEYYQFLKEMFIQHPIVLGVIAYHNSGFINYFLKEDNNQIMAITGISSKGKSTVLKLALSTWTDGQNFLSMNATQHGITHTLKSYNHNGICFDETGEKTMDNPERIKGFIYSLASGKDRLKMKKVGNDFDTEMPKRLFYSFLICGEKSIINGLKVEEGINARLCELFLDNNNRIFNFPDEEQKILSGYVEQYNNFILENYGWLAPDLIRLIKSNTYAIYNEYQKWLEIFRHENNFDSSIINRKLKIIPNISTVASLILDCVLVDELDKEMKTEILYEMQQAMSNALMNDITELEEKDPFKSALNSFEETMAGLFIEKQTGQEVHKDDRQINLKSIMGEIDISTSQKKILILANCFDEVVIKLGLDRKLFIAYLRENNLLEIGKDGKNQKLITRNGQPKRYYSIVIPMSFFNEPIKSEPLDNQQDFDDINPFSK